MFFEFKFWHFLSNPRDLAGQLQTLSMRGFGKRAVVVFLIGIILFAIRDLWGMGTHTLTSLLTTMTTADYTLARYASLIGALGWSIVYMLFHLLVFSYMLQLVTGISFKKLLPLQLLMTGLLLIEKALVFIVFLLNGAVASVSFLSFGPLAATFLEDPYLVLFLNQITFTMAVIIALQYKFIREYLGSDSSRKGLLWILIGIHIVMALITAAVGVIPTESLFNLIVGGVGNE